MFTTFEKLEQGMLFRRGGDVDVWIKIANNIRDAGGTVNSIMITGDRAGIPENVRADTPVEIFEGALHERSRKLEYLASFGGDFEPVEDGSD